MFIFLSPRFYFHPPGSPVASLSFVTDVFSTTVWHIEENTHLFRIKKATEQLYAPWGVCMSSLTLRGVESVSTRRWSFLFSVPAVTSWWCWPSSQAKSTGNTTDVTGAESYDHQLFISTDLLLIFTSQRWRETCFSWLSPWFVTSCILNRRNGLTRTVMNQQRWNSGGAAVLF